MSCLPAARRCRLCLCRAIAVASLALRAQAFVPSRRALGAELGSAQRALAPAQTGVTPRCRSAAASSIACSMSIGDGSSSSSGKRAPQHFSSAPDVTSRRDTLDDDEPVKLPEIVAPELLLNPAERLALWQEICELEPKLQAAIEAEDFSTAAELRERVTSLKMKDPYFGLREALDGALAREDYYSAAKFKLQLDKLGAPAGMLDSANSSKRSSSSSSTGGSSNGVMRDVLSSAESSATAAAAAAEAQKGRGPVSGVSEDGKRTIYSTKSEATTNGVRIEVRSQFYPEQSNPLKDQYVFVYHVRITNASPNTVQLVSRRWQIRSINPKTGKPQVQEVTGPGVVGQQPVLEPSQSFEYSSCCPINVGPKDGFRVLGRMEGSFLMVTGAIGEQGFDAKIAPFYLILPSDVTKQRGGPKSGGSA